MPSMSTDQMQDLLNVLENMLLPDNVAETIEDASSEKVEEYCRQLQSIYSTGFRHRYSELSSFLESQSPDVYSSLDIWLTAILSYGEEHDLDENTKEKIIKLLDHFRLETMRIDRIKAVKQYSDDSVRINAEMKLISQQASNTAKIAERKVRHFNEQSIAILSIFSAVILAFMGGISFSSGILGSISQASMFRLIITILLLGFVLFNSIFILMRFIAYMINEDGVDRFNKGITTFNIALGAIALLLILLYCCGKGSYIESWGRLQETSSQSNTQMV